MSKAIKFGLGGILAILLIGFLVLTLSVDSIVKSGIESVGSEMTGTAVTVERVSISPFSGSGTISGFRVENPEDFGEEYALEIDDFSIELNIRSLFSDEIVVHDIEVTSPSVYVEQKMPENNLRIIMDHIESTSSDEASEKALVIEHFIMTNGSADLYTEVGGERSARVEIAEIELNDIGRGGERQAVENVIREIADAIVDQSLRAAAQSGAEQIQDAIQDFLN
ncbi:hypothetical protein [Rhodohalobacter barkolensis]|uniref:AsmA domain-containing protein n=1 Tax=Rhodohalobacter barkolensis TaxID=2053187 RepID=A0A2N0VKY6_9BACT|nr:hypothetical protein [Rhodohalobacter barkolensis]PKD44858.1 hypothetical protein CWD77_05205 [Rhodohalobacter barkolensis]